MSGLEARAPNPTLLLPDALQLHVVPIKRETARVGDMHGFQRDDDIVASEIDRARARIALTILPGKLSRVPFTLPAPVASGVAPWPSANTTCGRAGFKL